MKIYQISPSGGFFPSLYLTAVALFSLTALALFDPIIGKDILEQESAVERNNSRKEHYLDSKEAMDSSTNSVSPLV